MCWCWCWSFAILVADRPNFSQIDYYGATFDHLVSGEDSDLDVLQINIIEIDNDDGAYANEVLPFTVHLSESKMKKILAVPRCCQKRKGIQDRFRINESVRERDNLSRTAESGNDTTSRLESDMRG
jgi:hypothetical protein